MDYVIGDVQGCDDALERLLAEMAFSPSRDRLFVLGDLVNRGPASLATLRRLRGLGDAATCLLGNHDLHLLAVAHGVRPQHKSDTLADILQAPDRDAWLDWLRRRRMAVYEGGWLMVHAGVVPQWDRATTQQLAGELEQQLRGPDLGAFLRVMYGNEPARWSETLAGHDRLRFAVNVLTRIRFVSAHDGTLELKSKEGAGGAPPGCVAWFDAPGRLTAGTPIAFGHWSTLGLVNRPDLLALDTGCVWGGQLSAARIDGGRRELIQVQCAQAQRPG
jgi:bis(5'-nucleosyl)-tetraphosphatase (symmetrical)